MFRFTGEMSIVLAIAMVYSSATECDILCKCSKPKMTCVGYMPYELPSGINSLIVDGLASNPKMKKFWTDSSWTMLESLTLCNYPADSIDINVYNFSNLVNLTYFGLHSIYFDELYSQHLKAMPNLKELDLSGTIDLTFPRIISALSGGNLPYLEVLNLDSVASNYIYTSMNRFDDTFVDVLVEKPLKKLIITNTMLEINGTALFRLSSLEVLNISGPWVPLYGPPIPTIKGRTLKTLDISNSVVHIFKTKADIVFKDENVMTCEVNSFYQTLLATTNLFINNVVHMSVSIVNVTLNGSCYQEKHKVHTKSLHLRKNGFKILDFDVTFLSGLNSLDLSENILEYISPKFLQMVNLSVLELSSNNLHEMEQKSSFELLFKYLINLGSINLSFNQISLIPIKIFLYNKYLSVINLSFNKISIVAFKIQHLSNLKVLDLKGNRINTIEMSVLKHLDKLSINPSFGKRQMNNNVIILSNNQFHCTCRNVAFLNWVVTRYEPMEQQDYPSCILEDKSTRLDQSAIEDSKYLCIKYAIVVSTSASSALLAIAIFVISVLFYIRRRRRIQVDKLRKLTRLLQNQNDLKYLLFVSFCGEDEQLVKAKICPRLLESLQARVGCIRDLLCIGDNAMLPGFPINEQIHDSISESYVVAAIVSNNFCESHWCETELKEAVYQHKPIIMFIVDRVDEDLMSPYMLSLFRRYTRVKVTTKGHGFELTPAINIICGAMLELAACSVHY